MPLASRMTMLGGAVLALTLAAAPTFADGDATPHVPATTSGTTAVAVDQPVDFSGHLPGPRRTVLLQQRDATGWRTVDKGRSAADGSYTLQVPTWSYGRRALRAHAPAKKVRISKKRVHTYKAVTTDPRRVEVSYSYQPVGTADQFKVFHTKARWNPCAPITWAYNANGVGDPALDVITQSVKEVSRATGIRFHYVGTTTKIPWRDKVRRQGHQPADLIIAWATPTQVPELANTDAGNVLGYGGATYGLYHHKPGTHRRTGVEYTNGGLVLDKTEDWMDMTYSSPDNLAWGQTVRHEVGHVMGLDHVDAPQQAMYDTAELDNEVYGLGDYAGLAALGAPAGCWPHAFRTTRTSNHGSARPSGNRTGATAARPRGIPAPMPRPLP